MTLDQLRIFVAVAEREHVTRAAAALNLTQSAVSSAIAALEAAHGLGLFERIGRGIRLTGEGRLFLPEARAVLARMVAAERTLVDIADLSRGRLSLAASQTLASYWLPDLLVTFRAAHPGIELAVSAGNSEQVQGAVRGLHADLGFVEGGETMTDLIDRPLSTDEMLIVVAPDHPWASEAPDARALARGRWVMREAGSGTRAHMDAALAALGAGAPDPTNLLELPTNEAVARAVRLRGGASLLSRLVVAGDLASGRLSAVALPSARRDFRLLRHPERHLTHAARAFLALIPPDLNPPDLNPPVLNPPVLNPPA